MLYSSLFADLGINTRKQFLEFFGKDEDEEGKGPGTEAYWFKRAKKGLPKFDSAVWEAIILKGLPKTEFIRLVEDGETFIANGEVFTEDGETFLREFPNDDRLAFLARIVFLATEEHRHYTSTKKLRKSAKSGGLYKTLSESLEDARNHIRESLNTLDEIQKLGGGAGRRELVILEYMLSREENYNDRTNPYISQLKEVSIVLKDIGGDFDRLKALKPFGQKATHAKRFIGEIIAAYDCVHRVEFDDPYPNAYFEPLLPEEKIYQMEKLFDYREKSPDRSSDQFHDFLASVFRQTYGEERGRKTFERAVNDDKDIKESIGYYNDHRGYGRTVERDDVTKADKNDLRKLVNGEGSKRAQKKINSMSESDKKRAALKKEQLEEIKRDTGLYGIAAVEARKKKYGDD